MDEKTIYQDLTQTKDSDILPFMAAPTVGPIVFHVDDRPMLMVYIIARLNLLKNVNRPMKLNNQRVITGRSFTLQFTPTPDYLFATN